MSRQLHSLLNMTLNGFDCMHVYVQHRTLETVLDRGEKLDDLVGKSEELSLHSKAFYTTVSAALLSLSVCLCPAETPIQCSRSEWSRCVSLHHTSRLSSHAAGTFKT